MKFVITDLSIETLPEPPMDRRRRVRSRGLQRAMLDNLNDVLLHVQRCTSLTHNGTAKSHTEKLSELTDLEQRLTRRSPKCNGDPHCLRPSTRGCKRRATEKCGLSRQALTGA